MEMKCPKCGHQLRIKDKYVGRRGACKYCKTPIDVPELSPEQAVPAVPPPLPKSESTALDDLGVEPVIPADAPVAPAPPHAAPVVPLSVESHKPLGCLFWLCVVFLTPIALIWAFVLPRDHPQRRIAILVPALLLALSFVFVALAIAVPFLLLAGNYDEIIAELDQATVYGIEPATVQMEVSPSDFIRLEIARI